MNFRTKFRSSSLAIAIVIFVGLVIDMSLKNWEKEERVIEHDIHWYYGYLPAKFIYNDIKLEKSDYHYGDNHYFFWIVTTPDNKKVIKTTMGLAMLYAPFFFIAHETAQLLNYPANGFSEPYKLFLLLSALFYLMVGLDFLRKILRHFSFSEAHIAITILLIGLGTNLLCYSSQSAPMSHVYNFCLLAIFIYYTIRWYESYSIKHTLILGFLLGLISLIRPSNAVIIIFFIFYGISSLKELKERLLFYRRECFLLNVMFFCAFIVWIPQFMYWKTTTGNYILYSYTDEGFFFNNPQIINGLFSFRKGWLVYTPILAFSLIGIPLLRGLAKKMRLAIILFFVINIYIIFSWWCWWYGGTFGQRSLIDSYALLAIPFASVVEYISEKRRFYYIVFFCISLFFIWLNIFQTYQFEHQTLHYDGMSKELYLKQFGKYERIPDYDKYIDWPNIEAAKKGGNYKSIEPNIQIPFQIAPNGKKEVDRKRIQLRALNDKYVCSDGAENNILMANRDEGREWETFTLIKFENGEFAIGDYKGNFLSIMEDQQNAVVALSNKIRPEEIFQVTNIDGNIVALKSSNGNYLTIDENTFRISATAKDIGKQEKFKFIEI